VSKLGQLALVGFEDLRDNHGHPRAHPRHANEPFGDDLVFKADTVAVAHITMHPPGPDSGCAWVADFAGLVPILPRRRPYFACCQSLSKDSGSAYRGSNPWGAAKKLPKNSSPR
jgi:hypothetical protein